MALFKRAIRIFLGIFALVAMVIAAATALLMRYMTRPPRLPIWASPKDIGLDYKEVIFPARDDGLRLSGWFVHGQAADTHSEPRPAVVLVHDWGWNRLGMAAEGPLVNLLRTSAVDFLRLTHALTHAGYHVLLFDLRNHGESAGCEGVTFGYQEALDLLGAYDYLAGRDDVSTIGTIGFAVGGNSTLYALTRLKASLPVKAAILVQPHNPQQYLRGLTRDVLGPLNKVIVPLVNLLSDWFSIARPSAINPLFAAAAIVDTPLLFLQEAADSWGGVDYVQTLAATAPATVDLIITTAGEHRYDGFNYLINHPAIAVDFFNQHL
jgi:dienelactone hydrolase